MLKKCPRAVSVRFKCVRFILSVSVEFYVILILAGALMLSSLPLPVEAKEHLATDNQVTAKTENDGDLSTTKFATLEGTVTVNLPPDTTAGDEISGTVVADPKGETPVEKAANQDTLEGYVVEVANQPAKEKDSGQWSIPPKADSIDVVLKKKTGEVVSRTKVTVRGWDPTDQATQTVQIINKDTGVPSKKDPATPPPDRTKVKGCSGIKVETERYQAPAVGQSGKYVRIMGCFNGDFRTTDVKIGDQPARPLAESPRGSIVKIPVGATGPTKIDVSKNGTPVASCPFTVLSIKLAAGNLTLKRGETSQLTVTVSGVRKLKSGVEVQVDNKFPQTMRLEGGDSQTLLVPADLDADGFSATRTLTGIQVGAFAITAVVKPPPCAAGGCSACNADSKATGPRVDTTPPTSSDAAIVKSKSNITNNRTASATTKWPAQDGPIEGLVVQISRKAGSIVATQLTDKDGNVDFGVLPEGEYVLTLIALRSSIQGSGQDRKIREWVKASMDGKTERVEMKPDSSRERDGVLADSGQVLFRADGKYRVKVKFYW